MKIRKRHCEYFGKISELEIFINDLKPNVQRKVIKFLGNNEIYKDVPIYVFSKVKN
jgi:hypothetical protein